MTGDPEAGEHRDRGVEDLAVRLGHAQHTAVDDPERRDRITVAHLADAGPGEQVGDGAVRVRQHGERHAGVVQPAEAVDRLDDGRRPQPGRPEQGLQDRDRVRRRGRLQPEVVAERRHVLAEGLGRRLGQVDGVHRPVVGVPENGSIDLDAGSVEYVSERVVVRDEQHPAHVDGDRVERPARRGAVHGGDRTLGGHE